LRSIETVRWVPRVIKGATALVDVVAAPVEVEVVVLVLEPRLRSASNQLGSASRQF
jgi:hypothetical protein